MALLLARVAPAQSIDLSLNVFYANPSNPNSGGTWEIVGKTSGTFGISGVEALVTNITTAQLAGPHGTVNGTDAAGFAHFFNTVNPLGFRDITIGQAPQPTLGAGEEQSVFYGVGTLTNGAPNYQGRPPGTTFIGPAFSSLVVPAMNSGIPWATGDAFSNAAWNAAAKLVTGTFPAGLTPAFFSGQGHMSSGNVFTTLGTSVNYGTIAAATVTTIVRTNLSSAPALPDYNRNGVVDAADYALWRNMLNQVGQNLAADGDFNGKVDQADYALWRANFGKTATPGVGSVLLSTSGASVPEPASAMLLMMGLWCLAGRTRRP